jgi:hypothetical protein
VRLELDMNGKVTVKKTKRLVVAQFELSWTNEPLTRRNYSLPRRSRPRSI